ncbi:MAG: hypothetical protein KJ667_05945 [Alphaproteobacteria bacterium]|nr:hypothetical protein [Alphaproteobacteria bacterium]
MTKQDSHHNDLSLASSDFLAWRVMRGKQRYQDKHKKQIVISRPRQRSEAHEVHN